MVGLRMGLPINGALSETKASEVAKIVVQFRMEVMGELFDLNGSIDFPCQ